jgi:hypothetical protein
LDQRPEGHILLLGSLTEIGQPSPALASVVAEQKMKSIYKLKWSQALNLFHL